MFFLRGKFHDILNKNKADVLGFIWPCLNIVVLLFSIDIFGGRSASLESFNHFKEVPKLLLLLII